MPDSQRPVQLLVEPSAIPGVRMSLEEAISEVQAHVARLGRAGFLPDAWMGDPVSESVRVDYNSVIMGPKDSLYAAMVGYEAELTRIHQSLQLMEEHYRRTEGEEVARWGRQA